jgi:hypothetical protein
MATFGTQNSVTFVNRKKYASSALAQALRNMLISREVFKWDTSGLKSIENPYVSTDGTVTFQAVAGTYSTSALATTEDNLIVADEVIVPTHIFDFEDQFATFDLFADFADNLAYQAQYSIDKFALNKVLSQATGTYTTPAGGFTVPANIAKIIGDLAGKIAGYQGGVANTPFLVIENTDLTGFIQTAMTSGFSYADAALNNGFSGEIGGVQVYVIRSGTFVTATLGTLSATNSGRRLFGIKGMAVVANPGGLKYEEKSVAGKTGMEVLAYGYVGAKVWAPQAGLFVNITLA